MDTSDTLPRAPWCVHCPDRAHQVQIASLIRFLVALTCVPSSSIAARREESGSSAISRSSHQLPWHDFRSLR